MGYRKQASPSEAKEIRKTAESNITFADRKAAEEVAKKFRDITDSNPVNSSSLRQTKKSELRNSYNNVYTHEKDLRNTSRYLYYRSQVYRRIIHWYADMWDLRCRKVIPNYDVTGKKKNNNSQKEYSDTLTVLDAMNLQSSLTEVLLRCYIEDVCYSVVFYDEDGLFFYILDPDYCIIDGRYESTGDFSFAVDMKTYSSGKKKKEIEALGEPFTSMLDEYQRTKQKYIHCPDEYACVLKFDTQNWQVIVPPLVPLFNSLINLTDLEDVQAVADEQQIYKLVYMPMKTRGNAGQADQWEITPEKMLPYFDMLRENALPDYISAAPIPGDELKTIEFNDNAANDTNRVQKASDTVLSTSGGGAVINASNITSTAAFNAWLKAETEFAISTLLPQINGFTNRFISYHVSNPCKVEHFEISVYTKDELAKSLLESCQYSFSNRLAYNTFLGFSERDTLAMIDFENNVLKLPETMDAPLTSSFTASSKGGAPEKDASELTDSGDRDRNR